MEYRLILIQITQKVKAFLSVIYYCYHSFIKAFFSFATFVQYVKLGTLYPNYGNLLWYLYKTTIYHLFLLTFYSESSPAEMNSLCSTKYKVFAWKITDYSVQKHWMQSNNILVGWDGSNGKFPWTVFGATFCVAQTQLLAGLIYVSSYGGGLMIWASLKWEKPWNLSDQKIYWDACSRSLWRGHIDLKKIKKEGIQKPFFALADETEIHKRGFSIWQSDMQYSLWFHTAGSINFH